MKRPDKAQTVRIWEGFRTRFDLSLRAKMRLAKSAPELRSKSRLKLLAFWRTSSKLSRKKKLTSRVFGIEALPVELIVSRILSRSSSQIRRSNLRASNSLHLSLVWSLTALMRQEFSISLSLIERDPRMTRRAFLLRKRFLSPGPRPRPLMSILTIKTAIGFLQRVFRILIRRTEQTCRFSIDLIISSRG